ncbi:MAG: GNAT family N-acetyltransferase [Pseudomonadota bacterium]|jgi:ribosomal protein S18 acetylase RimI-like enzyme|nr:GNAT family N-acetyltransferase [Rubrivivax sp.]MCA3257541.1 GNAT family N-acetyltransferase [Rubrivivax sp.]MCE2912457.1 GNAT family N-acetyltransferase [Rubrivivax sp.]MCZ8029917.1 GNAT family N-acetyltransferase [Rubrivivax sp.]
MTAQPLPVVPISEAHVEGFRAALDVVAREKRFLAMFEAPPLAQVRAHVRDGIAQGVAQFVALDGTQVVGWADVFPGWAHGVQHRGSLGMGLLPAWRGQGLGRRLLEACIAATWARGLTRIELEVRVDNAAAIRLYERAGFGHEGIKRNAIRVDGVHVDTHAMSLLAPVPAGEAGAGAVAR